MDTYNKLSSIAKVMRGSAIRELLKYANNPHVISFAGGLPNPQSFPMDKVKKIVLELIDEQGSKILQYGTTEGVMELRELISKRIFTKNNIKVDPDNILILSGSQQGLYMFGKIFIDAGDVIITEAPTYVGALTAFRSHFPKIIGIDIDENGMKVDQLDDMLRKMEHMPKFIYTIPTFQNPAGVTMSLERRKYLLELASKYNLIIIEDDPYSELRFTGEKILSIAGMDDEGRTLYMGTFSKILAPGLRLGFVAGEAEIIKKLNLSKQATDLCTSTFSQYIAVEYLKRGFIDSQIPKIKEMYRKKRDLMLNALNDYAPQHTEWSKPDGGMFLWLTADPRVDTQQMFTKAIKKGVAYVMGSAFYPNHNGKNSMRLNFTYPTDEDIVEGIKRLTAVLREAL